MTNYIELVEVWTQEGKPVKLWECVRCGSAVSNKEAHDDWHSTWVHD